MEIAKLNFYSGKKFLFEKDLIGDEEDVMEEAEYAKQHLTEELKDQDPVYITVMDLDISEESPQFLLIYKDDKIEKIEDEALMIEAIEQFIPEENPSKRP